MSVTEDIKAKLDIVTYIQQFTPLKKAGRAYKACCPFHAEKTPSFVVNPDTQTWRCFGACAEGGDLFNFAMKKHGWSFSEALQELARLAGVDVRPQTPVQKAREEAHDLLRGLVQVAAALYHQHLLNNQNPDSQATLRYAQEKRGFTLETITRFGIGYAPPGWQNMTEYLVEIGYSQDQIVEAGIAVRSETGRVYDRFRNRLMIPIRDERGRVVGFGARALDPQDTPKYLNSPQTPLFDKSKLLFGLDYAKNSIRDSQTAVIVEGYMDAIQAHQAGFNNVVAQMGTALTETQLKLVAPKWAKKIILALDADAAGQNATLRSLEVARQTLQADFTGRLAVDMRILLIDDAKDPDDLIRENPQRWQALVENALPTADFVIETELAHLPENPSVQEKQNAVQRLLPILLASENTLYTTDNLQKLARRLRVAERDLLAWAQEHPPAQTARPSVSHAEPPPLDYDKIASTGNIYKQSETRQQQERRCLRMLLLNPGWYYQINRKFRTLANDSPDLANGPLSGFSAEDFTHGDYRLLMQIFQEALNQDEQDPLDFMREQANDTLIHEMELCLMEELEGVQNHVKHRMQGETVAVWKHHERFTLPTLNLSAELIFTSLTLRQRRLQREREELRFLQLDSQNDGAEDEINRYIMLSMRAKTLIDTELKDFYHNFS